MIAPRRAARGPGTGSARPRYNARSNAKRKATMKADIHPDYVVSHVRCTCGNEFETRSTKPEIRVEICSNCHPFYTGRQKLVDSGGRVERFQRKLARRQKG